jgi:hypothetical protein
MPVTTINEAIKALKENCKDAYAKEYLNAIPDAIECGGTEGLCIQLLYTLENCKAWTGEEAKQTKAFIRKWIKQKEAKKKV